MRGERHRVSLVAVILCVAVMQETRPGVLLWVDDRSLSLAFIESNHLTSGSSFD
jgi:hypothetical protein